MTEKIWCTSCGASPSEGSSSKSNRGRLINARAIESICCSPPDSVPPRWSRRFSRMGNSWNTRATSSSKWANSFTAAPICKFSNTVMRGKMRRPSGACAILARTISWVGSWVISRPSKTMLPSRAHGVPQIVIIKVDFPAPLAPISVTISPSRTSRSTPLSAMTLP